MSDRREQIDRILAEVEREAYARGYNDAIAAVTAAAVAAKPTQSESLPIVPEIQPAAASADRRRGRPPKAIGLVRDLIFAESGLKGVEVAKGLEKRGTPVLERTVRSCLRRLRDHGEIRQRKGRWYPTAKEVAENENGEAVGSLPH